MNSPPVFALTSSANFSTCSVKALRLPQTDTFHSSANVSVANPRANAVTLTLVKIFIIFSQKVLELHNVYLPKLKSIR